MIKNLVVNGASGVDDRPHVTWATFLSKKYQWDSYHNLGSAGCGNDYICDSTIQLLEKQQFDPKETLVIIMWSGVGRKDLAITGEWYYHLKDSYGSLRNHNDEEYYLFSGGLTNAWEKNKTTKKIFEWLYKLSDPVTICVNSLLNFINLENYLKVHGYNYKFTVDVNCWTPANEGTEFYGDHSIGYFCADLPIYQNFDFSNWFFINDQKDGLGQFIKYEKTFTDTLHTSAPTYEKFAEQIVIPQIAHFMQA